MGILRKLVDLRKEFFPICYIVKSYVRRRLYIYNVDLIHAWLRHNINLNSVYINERATITMVTSTTESAPTSHFKGINRTYTEMH